MIMTSFWLIANKRLCSIVDRRLVIHLWNEMRQNQLASTRLILNYSTACNDTFDLVRIITPMK